VAESTESPNIRLLAVEPRMTLARLVYTRDLLRELVRRDTKVRYEGTLLGYLWLLVKPLLTVGVLFFTFQVVLTLDIPRFTSFALIGILAFTWFQSSLVDAAFIALANRDLVRRPQFKVAVLPPVAVMTNVLHFLFALPILAVVLWIDGSAPSAALLAMPVVIAIQFIITTGLAYFAAAASVLFRDIGHLISVALTLFFFVSPVFYDAAQVPAAYQSVYRLNPLVALLEAYRRVLIDGLAPHWNSLLTVAVVGVALVVGGYLLFEKVSHRFAEEL
jgi:lipopolysaccharide transport system permease protein